MDVLAWPDLARNAMWIVGLALVLAAVSHASWRASVRGEGLRGALGDPAFLIPVSAGLLLVTASLGWGATFVWERGLWAASSIALSWHIFELIRRQRAR